MPSISEPSLSILALPPPGSTKVVVLVLGVIVATAIIHYASPMRLTRVLVATIAATEQSYLEAIETGLLSPYDVDTAEMLSSCIDPLLWSPHLFEISASLQLKVSNIREATLIDSRSDWKALRGFLRGCALTILRFIWEVRDLEAYIEVINSGLIGFILKDTEGKPTAREQLESARDTHGVPSPTPFPEFRSVKGKILDVMLLKLTSQSTF
ncbi:hypothetical protein B0H13DRAFT_2399567 [Mycena leptocephala]|nr:hypothetical protein B0H13DRAFT_2399567 [Mycena leptocephala]